MALTQNERKTLFKRVEDSAFFTLFSNYELFTVEIYTNYAKCACHFRYKNYVLRLKNVVKTSSFQLTIYVCTLKASL